MTRLRANRARDEGGASLVEFAIVLPLFAMLLLAIVQFGVALNDYLTLTDAVRAGSRKAAVSRFAPNPSTAAETAVRNAATGLEADQLDVTISPAPPWVRGSEVTITATYPYEINVLGLVVSAGDLTSTMVERVE